MCYCGPIRSSPERPPITPPGDSVGIRKRDGMRRELDRLARQQAAGRTALDPLGIFNPGKG